VEQNLAAYFRVADCLLPCATAPVDFESAQAGFFQFGRGHICYGRSVSGAAANVEQAGQFDAYRGILTDGPTVRLPFNFTEVIDNLRLERYREKMIPGLERFAASEPVRKLYYFLRGCLPVPIRRQLQKAYFSDWKDLPFPSWPIDFTVDILHEELLRLLMKSNGTRRIPFIWYWPEGKSGCLIMTHDVETSVGRDFTFQLMDLDDAHRIKASYQVIPEKRYTVPDEYVAEIRERGCEFNVHDLNHDGHLYWEREEFTRRAARINGYVHRYGCDGFRSGAMYRKQDWYDVFEFSYDMSVPNVAHLEPMRGGCCTVFPYFVGKIVELPLTAAQDYSLFHILNDYSLDLWKRQLALIRERNGLISFITHPDYLIEERARSVYKSLLEYLRRMIDGENIWAVLPGEVDRWWRARSQMRLVLQGGEWEIIGPQKERARVAYAVLDGDRLSYELAEPCVSRVRTENTPAWKGDSNKSGE
jgi:hypothetical protein